MGRTRPKRPMLEVILIDVKECVMSDVTVEEQRL